jgi:hypothetical protein
VKRLAIMMEDTVSSYNPSTSISSSSKKGKIWPFKKRYLGIAGSLFLILFSISLFLGIRNYRNDPSRRVARSMTEFKEKKSAENAQILFAAILEGGEATLSPEKVEELKKEGFFDQLSEEQKKILNSIIAGYVVEKDLLPECEANFKTAWNDICVFVGKEKTFFGPLLPPLLKRLENISDFENTKELLEALKDVFETYNDKIAILSGDQKTTLQDNLTLFVTKCYSFRTAYNKVYKLKSQKKAGTSDYSKFVRLSRLNLMPFMEIKDHESHYGVNADLLDWKTLKSPFDEPDDFPKQAKDKLIEIFEDSNNDNLDSYLNFSDHRTKFLELQRNFLDAIGGDTTIVDDKLKFTPLPDFEKLVKEEIILLDPKLSTIDAEASHLMKLIGANFDFITMTEFFEYMEKLKERVPKIENLDSLDLTDLEKACCKYLRVKYCRLHTSDEFTLLNGIEYLLGPVKVLKRRKMVIELESIIEKFIKSLEEAHAANPHRDFLNEETMDALRDLKSEVHITFLSNIFSEPIMKTIFYHLLKMGPPLKPHLDRFKEVFKKIKEFATFLGDVPAGLISHAKYMTFRTKFKNFSMCTLSEDEESKKQFLVSNYLRRENVRLEKLQNTFFKSQDTKVLFFKALNSLIGDQATLLLSNYFVLAYAFCYTPWSDAESHKEIQESIKARILNGRLVELLEELKKLPVPLRKLSRLIIVKNEDKVKNEEIKNNFQQFLNDNLNRRVETSVYKAILDHFFKARVDSGSISFKFDGIFKNLFGENFKKKVEKCLAKFKLIDQNDPKQAKPLVEVFDEYYDEMFDKFADDLIYWYKGTIAYAENDEIVKNVPGESYTEREIRERKDFMPVILELIKANFKTYLTILAKEKLSQVLNMDQFK